MRLFPQRISPDDIFDEIKEPDIITPEFRETAKTILSLIQEQRKKLGIPPYTGTHATILLRELFYSARLHKDSKRHNGTPYFDTHLIGTVRNLINDQAVTGITSIVAGLKHDDCEDYYIQPENLLNIEKYRDLLDAELPEDIRSLRETVANLVTGLSKVTRASEKETAEATFAEFLKAIRDHGVRVAFIKIADRTHNVETLEGHPSLEKRKAVVNETEGIYIPIARDLQIRQSVARLVDCCVQFSNPELFFEFGTFRDKRHEAILNPYEQTISDAFRPTDDKSKRVRKFLKAALADISIHKTAIAKYVSQYNHFDSLSLKDLKIYPEDTLFEIVVIIRSDVSVFDMIRYISQQFAGGTDAQIKVETPHQEKPPKKGVTIKIYNKKFGGILCFRINDSISEARAKRGALASFADNVSPDMKEVIDVVLGKSERGHSSIFQLAEQELLRPRIMVRTKDNENLELPKGATVIDFAGRIHSNVLINLQGARVKKDIFDPNPEILSPFDELQDGKVVIAETDDSNPRVDPAWLLFCRTETARTVLRKHCLRNPLGDKEASREEIESAIRDIGAKYAQKICGLFGMEEQILLQLIGWRYPKLARSSRDIVMHQIGRGSLDVMAVLADFCRDIKIFKIKVILKDESGSLNRFLAEFTSQKININKIVSHEKGSGEDEITLEIKDPSGLLTVYDILKILLKLSYTHKIQVAL